MRPYLREIPGGVRLEILVQPRASRSKIVGEHDGRLKVALAAPPVDGEANEALLKLLAKLLGVPRRAVRITSGETGRRKVVEVEGADPARLASLP
ncbi:MAG: DUF167 domain-containing protein [Deltaproteobacteria bacterium]|nr:DUF167 domain-containing protein [Deltaproteobacteria bacterium]